MALHNIVGFTLVGLWTALTIVVSGFLSTPISEIIVTQELMPDFLVTSGFLVMNILSFANMLYLKVLSGSRV
jgi:hypothetical protein